jgi:hypothetical protein
LGTVKDEGNFVTVDTVPIAQTGLFTSAGSGKSEKSRFHTERTYSNFFKKLIFGNISIYTSC